MKDLSFSILNYPSSFTAFSEYCKTKEFLEKHNIEFMEVINNEVLGSNHPTFRPKMTFTNYIIRFKNPSDLAAYFILKD